MTYDLPPAFTLDGQAFATGIAGADPLARAVVVSLFTWRRANPDDDLPGDERMGWWGDTYAHVLGDRIGSRLWLLCRATLTEATAQRAREYAQEALQWLVDDGVAARVDVQVERQGLHTLALSCQVTRAGGASGGPSISVRFANVWEYLRAI